MNDTLPWIKFTLQLVVVLGGLAVVWSKLSVRLALIEAKLESISDNVTSGDCELRQERCPARRDFITGVREQPRES